MTFDVEVGDRMRTVTVQRKGQFLHVDVAGRLHIVDARRIGDATLSLLIATDEKTVPVKSVDVALSVPPGTQRGSGGGEPGMESLDRTAGAFDVHIGGRTIGVVVRQAGAFGRQKREGDKAPVTGPQRIVAPMPGKIVRVLVKAGDEVKVRQGLVVVEAMKMENELRAVRDGRVREVAVTEGQSVDAGAVLMVVE